ncbi:hypothetical protein [Sphingomonas psychrotolerans]|nr:hypothetical protein [Sphingomonas psychrotolerans]
MDTRNYIARIAAKTAPQVNAKVRRYQPPTSQMNERLLLAAVVGMSND